MSLQHKVVVITGANRGLGLGLASQFAANGARVIGCCRRPAEATELAKIAKAVVELDMSKAESCIGLLDRIKISLGTNSKIDFLLNNAGVSHKDHPNEPTLANLDRSECGRLLETNVLGTLEVTKALLPLLASGGEPSVVMNMSSDLGSIHGASSSMNGQPGLGDKMCYRISKAALNMATVCLAKQLEGKATVIAMSPGWVATDMGSSGGRVAPLTVEQSCRGIFSVVTGLKEKDSGAYLDFKGDVVPW
eukprot:TRINITY_DN8983_c0_g2_i1.p1 TRINITY_DN8983_c0_g2~~TRINITY_DN8983_c0_g2_i1.p1  ORF type:complete len:273 (-),score=16.53 TRINITY_DN8983_c0_g2_i1:165-911(-)